MACSFLQGLMMELLPALRSEPEGASHFAATALINFEIFSFSENGPDIAFTNESIASSAKGFQHIVTETTLVSTGNASRRVAHRAQRAAASCIGCGRICGCTTTRRCARPRKRPRGGEASSQWCTSTPWKRTETTCRQV